MITAAQPKGLPTEHVCPRCGHVGLHPVSVPPTAAHCVQGNESYWLADLDGEVVRFDSAPSQAELIAERDKRRAAKAEAEAEPKRRKVKDVPQEG